MVKQLLFLLPLLTGVPLFITGALRRPPVALPAPFTAASITLAPDIAAIGPNGTALLDAASARLAPERLAWLHVDLWQRMYEPKLAYEAIGTLQLGPKHCARLEVSIHAGAMPGRWLVVSDGNAVAQVTQFGNEEPIVVSSLLAPPPVPEQPPPPPPAQVLHDLGCAGPHALLRDLRQRLQELTVETGRLQGRAVIRLRGRLDPASDARTAPAEFCYLYLDAQTLWPGRVEWRTPEGTRGTRLVLELEFRAPVCNRPLSLSECIRAFTYKPASTT